MNKYSFSFINKLHPLFIIFLFFFISSDILLAKPLAVKGFIDLSDWDFASKKPVELSGEWEFFHGTFIKTEDDYKQTLPSGFFNMPGLWNGYRIDGKILPGSLYGSYVIRIKLPVEHPPLALSFGEVKSSYEIISSWKNIGNVGKIGSSKDESEPEWRIKVLPLDISGGELFLVQNISNFHYAKGGNQSSPLLGSAESINSMREARRFFEIFLFGSIFIMAIYQVILFSSRRDPSILYFAFFCFLISAYLISTGEMLILSIFPQITWQALVKVIYLTLYISPFFFLRYMGKFFPDESSRIFRKIIEIILILLWLIVVFSPPLFFSSTLDIFHLIMVIISIASFRTVGRALYSRREGALPLFAGISVLTIAMINDVLHYQEIINTGDTAPAGVLILILINGFALSKRSSGKKYAKGYSKEEMVSPERINQIEAAAEFIKENFNSAISREGLAAKFNIHPDNFGRLFKQHTGKKIGEMINYYRIESAKRELSESDATVIEIAMKSGFENLRTFNRVFKDITGISPIEYRKIKKHG